MNREDQGKKMGQLIAKCWSDEAFKKKLLADPAATLKAQGLDVPAGVTITAHENTATAFHLVIPTRHKDLSDAELDKVAAGLTLPGLPDLPGTDIPPSTALQDHIESIRRGG